MLRKLFIFYVLIALILKSLWVKRHVSHNRCSPSRRPALRTWRPAAAADSLAQTPQHRSPPARPCRGKGPLGMLMVFQTDLRSCGGQRLNVAVLFLWFWEPNTRAYQMGLVAPCFIITPLTSFISLLGLVQKALQCQFSVQWYSSLRFDSVLLRLSRRHPFLRSFSA